MALMQSARRAAGPAASRFFSTASVAAGRYPVAGLPKALPPAVSPLWMVGAAAAPRRFAGTAAAGGVDVQTAPTATAPAAAAKKEESEKEAASYWGVAPTRLVKEDGTVWKWSCFRPWDTYEADVSIDLTKHHDPATLGDKVARWTVKSLRWPVDLFFQRRYGCRAMMLETDIHYQGHALREVAAPLGYH
uniref:ubiquinol oxidase (non-electrogenic) n=1 Tax=Oryza punctata TaxID=4537 RepID=A0A0E0JZ26_ORYPU